MILIIDNVDLSVVVFVFFKCGHTWLVGYVCIIYKEGCIMCFFIMWNSTGRLAMDCSIKSCARPRNLGSRSRLFVMTSRMLQLGIKIGI